MALSASSGSHRRVDGAADGAADGASVAHGAGAVGRPLRRDFLRNRQALLRAVESLLADRGTGFSMAELASTAAVSTATVYRHFEDISQALQAYYDQLVGGLIGGFERVAATDPLERFDTLCAIWVAEAARWGRAAVQIRSAQGYLSRLRQQDPLMTAIHNALGPVVDDLVAAGLVAVPSVDYAVLLWTTIFDERVIIDLTGALGWSVARTTRELRASTLGALGYTGTLSQRLPSR